MSPKREWSDTKQEWTVEPPWDQGWLAKPDNLIHWNNNETSTNNSRQLNSINTVLFNPGVVTEIIQDVHIPTTQPLRNINQNLPQTTSYSSNESRDDRN